MEKDFGPANQESCPAANGLWVRQENAWYHHLLERTEFRSALVARLKTKAYAFSKTLAKIDTRKKDNLYSEMAEAFDRNFEKWDVMGEAVWSQPDDLIAIDTVKGQVDFLHDWLFARYKFVYESYTGEEFILP